MKKQLIILLFGIAPFAGQAQFKKLINKVKDKVDQRVSLKKDKAIDGAPDKAEGKNVPSTESTTITTEKHRQIHLQAIPHQQIQQIIKQKNEGLLTGGLAFIKQ